MQYYKRNYVTTFLDTQEQKNDWDLLLNLLCYAYKSSVHTNRAAKYHSSQKNIYLPSIRMA